MSPALSGANYEAGHWAAATDDADGAGSRWVATDESGWDGEQLFGRQDRFFTVGSVALDDAAAADLLAALRSEAKIRQPVAELKFKMFSRSARRLEALAETVAAADLAGGVIIYFLDKHYMVASKIIDLLVEELYAAAGLNLYANALNVRMGRVLALDGPADVGADLYVEMLQLMTTFASDRNVDANLVSPAQMMACFARAHAACRPGQVRDVLSVVLQAEAQARELIAWLGRGHKNLEPLIPAMAALVGNWVTRLGPIRCLVDEQIVLTDDILDVIARTSALELNEGRTGWALRDVAAQVYRGRSLVHPSIQLADLLAGGGLLVARAEMEADVQVPASLRAAVLKVMDPHSLLPHDETDRLLVT